MHRYPGLGNTVSIAFTDTISIILPIVSNPEEFGLKMLQAGRFVIFTCCHVCSKNQKMIQTHPVKKNILT